MQSKISCISELPAGAESYRVSVYIWIPEKNLFHMGSWKSNAKSCLYKYMAQKDIFFFTFKFGDIKMAK